MDKARFTSGTSNQNVTQQIDGGYVVLLVKPATAAKKEWQNSVRVQLPMKVCHPTLADLRGLEAWQNPTGCLGWTVGGCKGFCGSCTRSNQMAGERNFCAAVPWRTCKRAVGVGT